MDPRNGWAIAAVLVAGSLVGPADARPACRAEVERVRAGTWATRPVRGIEGVGFTFRVAVDAGDPRLIVVTDTRGILVSRDGGCSWNRSLVYEEVLKTIDVAVAGSGADRSLHALVTASLAGDRKLISSFDDGASWEVRDVPALALRGDVELASSEASQVLYLLAETGTGIGTLFAGTGTGGDWRWVSLNQPLPASGTCVSGGPCAAPDLDTIAADPSRSEAVWALGTTTPNGRALVRSSDEGATWDELPAPNLVNGARHLVLAARRKQTSVMMIDVYGRFAVSGDGGRSWAGGKHPEVACSAGRTYSTFELAGFGRGAFAVVFGTGDDSPWAGNLHVFDGRGWTDVSPAAYAGCDRTDEGGRALTFVELAGSRGPLVALTSTGDLMTYRR